jgi:GNAT superfamily N-acetyltransferase
MNYEELKIALGRNLGQTLTPELVLGILTAVRPQQRLLPDTPAKAKTVGDYTYQLETVHDALDAGIGDLSENHWLEVEGHRHSLGWKPDWTKMSDWESEGRFIVFTVRHREWLVGYMAFHISDGHHTGRPIATEDGLYVSPEHRRGRVGINLIFYAEEQLLRRGVGEIHVVTKDGTVADRLVDRLGYTHASNLRIKTI